MAPSRGGRPWTFYVLAALFTFYVIALYGPMICIYILSFQDVRGGLVFPMKGLSLHWFVDLFTQVRTGDVKGAFNRSIKLAIVVTVITVVISFMSATGVPPALSRRQHRVRADDRQPGRAGPRARHRRRASVQRARHRDTPGTPRRSARSCPGRLPFGVLVMFAVMSRFDPAWEEAARDLGASPWQTIRLVIIPVLAPGLVAVALFGFTLSYDEFARTLQTAGPLNTLPLEIWSMTLNVTSPSLYALGTVTTIISFLIIGVASEPS